MYPSASLVARLMKETTDFHHSSITRISPTRFLQLPHLIDQSPDLVFVLKETQGQHPICTGLGYGGDHLRTVRPRDGALNYGVTASEHIEQLRHG